MRLGKTSAKKVLASPSKKNDSHQDEFAAQSITKRAENENSGPKKGRSKTLECEVIILQRTTSRSKLQYPDPSRLLSGFQSLDFPRTPYCRYSAPCGVVSFGLGLQAGVCQANIDCACARGPLFAAQSAKKR
jgi:hypothetical protein